MGSLGGGGPWIALERAPLEVGFPAWLPWSRGLFKRVPWIGSFEVKLLCNSYVIRILLNALNSMGSKI